MIIYSDCDAQTWYPKRPYKYVNFWNNDERLPTRIDGHIRNIGDKQGNREYMYIPSTFYMPTSPPTMIISNNSKYLQHKFFGDPVKDII